MSKILLIIVALIIAFGAFVFFGNKKTITPINQPKSTTKENAPVQSQPKEEIATVTLTDTGFTPKDITIKAGTRIIWVNKSGKAATVNSDDHPTHRLYPFLNLGEFANGATLQVVFDKKGVYGYHDHLNSIHTGTITVE